RDQRAARDQSRAVVDPDLTEPLAPGDRSLDPRRCDDPLGQRIPQSDDFGRSASGDEREPGVREGKGGGRIGRPRLDELDVSVVGEPPNEETGEVVAAPRAARATADA